MGSPPHEDGHAVLAYNYQSPDPTTGQGIAVDVIDPNVPWTSASPPTDYKALQVHVKADGSWTFAGTFNGVNFGSPVANGSGGLEVITHPLASGGSNPAHPTVGQSRTDRARAAQRWRSHGDRLLGRGRSWYSGGRN